MDISTAQVLLLSNPQACTELPKELLDIIRGGTSHDYISALALKALDSQLTRTIFVYFETIFADVCSQWILLEPEPRQKLDIVGAFARILPFASHLAYFAEQILLEESGGDGARRAPTPSDGDKLSSARVQFDFEGLPSAELLELLLSAYRLLQFNYNIFKSLFSPLGLQNLLRHDEILIRFLAIHVLCKYLHDSDQALAYLIRTYIESDYPIAGLWEGTEIDYRFLCLWEEKRSNEIKDALTQTHTLLESFSNSWQRSCLARCSLTPHVADICGVLIPRIASSHSKPSSLIPTPTTIENMRNLAQALLVSNSILLSGYSGSGKTAIIRDLARELNADKNMLTLHLNEQTDAKLLLGLYTTASTPGSFEWRPGVLTTAVKEGRWVLIEDFDHAPTEVISVILPLIERGELFIPNRNETISSARGFKIIATMRSRLNMRGEKSFAGGNMLGARLWHHVEVTMPDHNELSDIISGTHQILNVFLPMIMRVYIRIQGLYQGLPSNPKLKFTEGRPLSSRDLLKWCQRLQTLLVQGGSVIGTESIPESTSDNMFLEAIDCFTSSLQSSQSKDVILSILAEEMQLPPERVKYFTRSRVPEFRSPENILSVGRASLKRKKALSTRKLSLSFNRPFAKTLHSLRLLEQVSVAVSMAEPVLLVGETGIGKTAVVQQLAALLGHNLTVVNLSQQSEGSELLGGYKPVNVRSIIIPMKEKFDDLFEETFSTKKNQRYLQILAKCFDKAQWSRVAALWREALKMVANTFGPSANGESIIQEEQPKKKQKTQKLDAKLKALWENFANDITALDAQLANGSKGFAFRFIESNIVKAVRNGDWVLLDEINLASADTLESIADLLYGDLGETPSLLLSESGNVNKISAHPKFRIFGAMNPATDIGKRDLPIGLRSRFTEIYVDSPDQNLEDLLLIVKTYLGSFCNADTRVAHDVSLLYLEIKRLAEENRIVDGANQKPHFSLRTLSRTLSYVAGIAPIYGLRRAIYEGFSMSFLTLLDKQSQSQVDPLVEKYIFGNSKNFRVITNQTPRMPADGAEYILFKRYWMSKGNLPILDDTKYIITPFVERNMLNLIRATSAGNFPVLIQGPTSSGKTSMIEHIARMTGRKFVRINNHDHTDLQEYLGTYTSDVHGNLQFQDGLLVRALREGHWIVLDELNLAPTDVLEALNRLLDDNRELLIPETQEIVQPSKGFMLFATQNPPGLYGGRKHLSRAFRNRFLELHFDDIPEDELEVILRERSLIAPSFCTRIVAVYKELSLLRQSSRLFEQKNSFATLRDLFRWAFRDADDREQLAANGVMLLSERVRNAEERQVVKQVIEKHMKVTVNDESLYIAEIPEGRNHLGLVWTKAMQRLFVLVSCALKNNEPVLLVGETGCGKTSVCQMVAGLFSKRLYTVNAQQNTESADLIGAQRPIRNRGPLERELYHDLCSALNLSSSKPLYSRQALKEFLTLYEALTPQAVGEIPVELRDRIRYNTTKFNAFFEWSDGSLVQAMKTGQYFLLDEISLADDSVLERLNSVLETNRTLLLAEKGAENSKVIAADGFQFLATMNPGGQYGKRELSPALRNRFTEIWVPPLSDYQDFLSIVHHKIDAAARQFSETIVQFAQWFSESYKQAEASGISIRDVLAWVTFINNCKEPGSLFALVHGAATVFIDTLGANPAAVFAIPQPNILAERMRCLERLSQNLQEVLPLYNLTIKVDISDDGAKFGEFFLPNYGELFGDLEINFRAPTTKVNAMRVVRALRLNKPILLEGSPGVGKTTLIVALAKSIGMPLTRVNLSDQTDLMDLFGSDVPAEGLDTGMFAWRDAPFLQAMQRGHWILLDEMNLASQSVLEGLNACFDHRGEVYIAELDKKFTCHPEFRVFAAQNPHHQGGGRKGLPTSFVNRFTVVYAEIFNAEDLRTICVDTYPNQPVSEIERIIKFVSYVNDQVAHKQHFGSQGSPWEFNLRDILRWLSLLNSKNRLLVGSTPLDFLGIIIKQRFRNSKDQDHINKLFSETFDSTNIQRHYYYNVSTSWIQVGLAILPRIRHSNAPYGAALNIKKTRLPHFESMIICIQQNWPCLLVGKSGSGKSHLIRTLASIGGAKLTEFSLNSDIDAIDLVGGFEQVDVRRQLQPFLNNLTNFLRNCIIDFSAPESSSQGAIALLEYIQKGSIECLDFQEIFSRLGPIAVDCSGLVSYSHKVSELLSECMKLLPGAGKANSARFEWVDGVIIKALERGDWLVLDNANLCNSSVLDRLNSLLEPGGCLTIHEHPGSDGEPRIVMPHPDFRIFLTVDPKYGELSRAMRNRSIEIFIPTIEAPDSIESPQSDLPSCRNPSFSSFKHILEVARLNVNPDKRLITLLEVGFSQMPLRDIPLLSGWISQLNIGLVNNKNIKDILCLISSRYFMFWNTRYKKFQQTIPHTYTKILSKMGLDSCFIDSQPFCPLVNSAIVSTSAQHINTLFWLADTSDIFLENMRLMQQFANLLTGTDSIRPSEMTRLQRSVVSDRIKSFAKDSTAPLFAFLLGAVGYIEGKLLSIHSCSENWREKNDLLRKVVEFLYDLYNFTNSIAFDEASFRAHLEIGKSKLFQDRHLVTEMALQLELEINSFSNIWKLDSGLEMESLWSLLRPHVPRTSEQLAILMKLENLADRFDAAVWQLQKPIDQIATLQCSISNALEAVVLKNVDGNALSESLSKAISDLETHSSRKSPDSLPYFALEFEGLAQYIDLHQGLNFQPGHDTELPILYLLTGRPTKIKPAKQYARCQSTRLFAVIDYYAGKHSRLPAGTLALDGNLPTKILNKLGKLGNVALRSVDLLEKEVALLGKTIILKSPAMVANQATLLKKTLMALLAEIQKTHKSCNGFEPLAQTPGLMSLPNPHRAIYRSDEPIDTQCDVSKNSFHDIGCTYFGHSIPGLLKLTESYGSDGIFELAHAWTQFAIGCFWLYLPDKPFDPALKPQIQRNLHEEHKAAYVEKLEALQQFENIFSGQSTNIRCEIIQERIKGLGHAPQVPEIARPVKTELNLLQGEFQNLLKTVVMPSTIEILFATFVNDPDDSLSEIETIQKNTSQISKRLASNFRAYEDITAPVAGFIQCLNIGLSLVRATSYHSKNQTVASFLRIAEQTPFVGFKPTKQFASFSACWPMDAGGPDRSNHFLQFLGIIKDVEGPESMEKFAKSHLARVIHTYYENWKKELELEQEKTSAQSGLYRYRGGYDEESEISNEEIQELFPIFDSTIAEPTDPVSKGKETPQQTALFLSKALENLFHQSEPAALGIYSLIEASLDQINCLGDPSSLSDGCNPFDYLIPGILLSIENTTQRLQATLNQTSTFKKYNFYLDPNIAESKKLLNLIYEIQLRFSHLQSVWPEHATLEDVLTNCEALLEFSHTEPIAKFLAKAESLHSFIHEWQVVASKEFTVLELYNNLTNLLVSWRRLELATWARLFDSENEKCNEDAKSWWFLAYEVIVAASMGCEDSEMQMMNYALELLEALEKFFSTTTIGQFSQRLRLLRQFNSYMALFSKEMNHLIIVQMALGNFIHHYSRFENPISETILLDRSILEKQMKDVILLASWKDTNINALRDSARRSHHKLFKLVRKYRAILAKPVSDILSKGHPETPVSFTPNPNLSDVYYTNVEIDESTLDVCSYSIEGWKSRPLRFINTSATVSMMGKFAKGLQNLSGAEYLDSFQEALVGSISELQKETPSVLKEDNKDFVNHLKTRKRKLFADTLKQLREMGFRSSIGGYALSRQNSLSAILARTRTLPQNAGMTCTNSVEYHFHRLLDIVPQVREAAREHSADLAGGEVARSIGYIEGLLYTTLQQRLTLAKSLQALSSIQGIMSKMKAVQMPADRFLYHTNSSKEDFSYNYKRAALWLPGIIECGVKLFSIHQKFGGIDSSRVQSDLLALKEKFDTLASQWKALPTPPKNIKTSAYIALEELTLFSLEALRMALSRHLLEEPLFDVIISKILPWLNVQVEDQEQLESYDVSVSQIDSKLTKACDAILVVLQELPGSIDTPLLPTSHTPLITKENELRTKEIEALRASNVIELFIEPLVSLDRLDLNHQNASQLVSAVFALALPFVQKYHEILRESVENLGALHEKMLKMAYTLSKAFSKIASQGFCTPAERSDTNDSKTEKLESGTGLGDGEGAEDISKDIQDDEDLSELAQEPNKGSDDKDDPGSEKDALNIEDDLEGEMGNGSQAEEDDDKTSNKSENGEDEIDEEAGNVDDLDPTAVDEKLWDRGGDETEKEQRGEEPQGENSKDEQVAADEKAKDKNDEEVDGDTNQDEGADEMEVEEEDLKKEAEQRDAHPQEDEALELPEEMDLEGGKEQDKANSDDGFDDLSELNEDREVNSSDEDDTQSIAETDVQDGEANPNPDHDVEMKDADAVEEEDANQKNDADHNADDDPEEPTKENQDGLLQDHAMDDVEDIDDIAPSDVRGTGQDQYQEDQGQEQPSLGEAAGKKAPENDLSAFEKAASAENGEVGAEQQNSKSSNDLKEEQLLESKEDSAFKKLGDVLERWHQQQRKIGENSKKADQQKENPTKETEKSAEFEHLQDDEAQADTQALGTATEDQARALDDSMAYVMEKGEVPDDFQHDEHLEEEIVEEGALQDPSARIGEEVEDANSPRTGAMVGKFSNRQDEINGTLVEEEDEDMDQVEEQVSEIQLDSRELETLPRPYEEARVLWAHYETLTSALALSLTEQLRLVLAPTLATKMRGDFRTGKRLNIKRIIPYIASQFKRDKIWMRRSIPSKRNYQIMLAVDDSKSMGEGQSGQLAYETLALVSKSLSLLEAGQLCIVSFGDGIKVAHDFDAPFGSTAGARVFQHFGFQQTKTNVRALVSESIALFQSARLQSASSRQGDLWQLEIIISDGLCEDHASIRRLVRQALEEKIMLVFVIVDSGKSSVLEMQQAHFEPDAAGEMKLRMERYLDDFPFSYYLVVRDVKELPGVLATALRQWFAEVVDTSA
ncbi:MAG: hypothetical protein M1829_001948 [Trizodia sp. TS-e1964]|nr:MAG: hypothetical protein M1829_001948 [Trizodia sp. TS-e1964]